MSEQVIRISVRAAWRRALLAAAAALALFLAWQGLRWAAGSTLAEYAQDAETAEAAARLAPGDPQPHLRMARLRRASFLPEEVPKSLAAYERAAALAPNNYLFWMELGRARAAAGDEEGGLAALRRAAELAPYYAQPRWLLGNALLRAGRSEEAFAELRLAGDADPTLRPQVFNLAWQLYGGEVARVMDAVGRTPAARAQLVGMLIGRGLLDEAQKVWSGLSAEDRRRERAAGEQLANALAGGKLYRRAAQVLAEAGAPAPGAPGQLLNGGFESEIVGAGKALFGWQVWPAAPNSGAQVALDVRNARTGSRSLRVSFNASGQADPNVSQVVPVEPGARYRLGFNVRTEELKSAAGLEVVVTEAGSSAAIARSAPAPAGTAGWQQETFEFTAGPTTDGIVVRLGRESCPESVCPIYGKIWYDDFSLERVAGRATAR
ncbi:MAG TPA: carbohydrate binding domain-containing protein [Pyrinomonadaceae bacterium]|nr:carbohydrate binding domain-containing protein [Pyrinomonadaceae bacterium]